MSQSQLDAPTTVTKETSNPTASATTATILVVMGPCGCGKSEVGQKLGQLYNTKFIDADAYHPAENVAKMGQGIPLTDADRLPWLQKVRRVLEEEVKTRNPEGSKFASVLGCSSLKKSYRNILRGCVGGNPNPLPRPHDPAASNIQLIFILLDCSTSILQHRLQSRPGHFMKASMLESQLKTLEPPVEDELQDFVVVNGDLPLVDLVDEIDSKLRSLLMSL